MLLIFFDIQLKIKLVKIEMSTENIIINKQALINQSIYFRIIFNGDFYEKENNVTLNIDDNICSLKEFKFFLQLLEKVEIVISTTNNNLEFGLDLKPIQSLEKVNTIINTIYSNLEIKFNLNIQPTQLKYLYKLCVYYNTPTILFLITKKFDEFLSNNTSPDILINILNDNYDFFELLSPNNIKYFVNKNISNHMSEIVINKTLLNYIKNDIFLEIYGRDKYYDIVRKIDIIFKKSKLKPNTNFKIVEINNYIYVPRFRENEHVILNDFLSFYNKYTYGLCDEILLCGKIIHSGGSLYDIVTGYYNENVVDIDLFLYGSDIEKKNTIKRIIEILNKKYKIYIICQYSIISIYIENIPRIIQLICTKERNANDIVNKFDFSHVKMYYNGHKVFASVGCIKSLETQMTMIKSNLSFLKNIRIYKCLKRGLNISLKYKLYFNKELYDALSNLDYKNIIKHYYKHNNDFYPKSNFTNKENLFLLKNKDVDKDINICDRYYLNKTEFINFIDKDSIDYNINFYRNKELKKLKFIKKNRSFNIFRFLPLRYKILLKNVKILKVYEHLPEYYPRSRYRSPYWNTSVFIGIKKNTKLCNKLLHINKQINNFINNAHENKQIYNFVDNAHEINLEYSIFINDEEIKRARLTEKQEKYYIIRSKNKIDLYVKNNINVDLLIFPILFNKRISVHLTDILKIY